MTFKVVIGAIMFAIFMFTVRCLWDLFDNSNETGEDSDCEWEEFDEF